MKKIAIIGGGLMGVFLGHFLSKQGHQTTIFERGNNAGGLANYFDYDGVRIDRFYHTILSSDMAMINLIEESGVSDRFHLTETKQGFYDDGNVYPFSTPMDLLTFPPLNVIQRFRLGLQIVAAQFHSDWREVDEIPVEDWLMRVSGRKVVEKIWKPLLRSKFDTASDDIPATYIWSRLKRMLGTRQGVSSKEMMCYLENGYYTLVEAVLENYFARGGVLRLNTTIAEIEIVDGVARGVRLEDGETLAFDLVISTLPSPVLGAIIPKAPQDFVDLLNMQEYLGVLCPLMILDRKLTEYYVLNITDARIPFTGVIETTNLIDPKHVNGNHLVYLPKYIAWDNEMLNWSDDKVKTVWLDYVGQMFPDFSETWINDFIVQRARYVEPVRALGTSDQIPPIRTPVKNLYMGNTAMFYPDLGNGQAVATFVEKIVAVVNADLTTQRVPVVRT